MAAFTSTYPGLLITHEGVEINLGDTVNLTAAQAKVSGIADWIEKGWIVSGKDADSEAPAESKQSDAE